MRIAYVTTYRHDDKRGWSGLGYSLSRSLREAGAEIIPIGGLRPVLKRWYRYETRAYTRWTGMAFHADRTHTRARAYAAQVERRLRGIPTDVVLSPGTVPVAYLRGNLPMVFYTDGLFAAMKDYYPRFSNIHPSSVADFHRLDQAALDRCALAVFMSEWACRTAIQHYSVDPAKVTCVPAGANVVPRFGRQELEDLVAARPRDCCRLLFIGVEWGRKGGDIALQIAKALNQAGMPTELTIIGCTPPPDRDLPDYIRLLGVLRVDRPGGSDTIAAELARAHFFVLPTRAEAFGIAYAEASAFGVPSLATRTGGLETTIVEGRNGWLFDVAAPPEQYRDRVLSVMSDHEKYVEVAMSSRDEYEKRLNWPTAAGSLLGLMEQVLSTGAA